MSEGFVHESVALSAPSAAGVTVSPSTAAGALSAMRANGMCKPTTCAFSLIVPVRSELPLVVFTIVRKPSS